MFLMKGGIMHSEDTKRITFLDQRNRIYLPEIELMTSSEVKKVLDKTIVKGHNFYLTPDTPLTTNRIETLELQPHAQFDLFEEDQYRHACLSRPFRHKHRIFLYLYIQEGDSYIVRTIYQSGSHGLFTLLPDYGAGSGLISHYGKGNGEPSIREALPIQVAISQLLAEDKICIEYSTLEETVGAIAGPSRLKQNKEPISNTFFLEVQSRLYAENQYQNFLDLGPNDNYQTILETGYFNQPELIQFAKTCHKIVDEPLCSFCLPSVVYTENELTSETGQLTFDIYPSRDQSLLYYITRSEINIMMDETKRKQTWFSHIEVIKDNPITSMGVRKKWFPISALVRPGLDYKRKVPARFKNTSIKRIIKFDIDDETLLDGGFSLLRDEKNQRMIGVFKEAKYTDVTKYYQMRFPMLQRFIQ